MRGIELLDSTPTKEDFDEQKAKVEKVSAPIVTKLYGQGGDAGAETQPENADHEEL